MPEPDVTPPFLLRRADALAQGFSDDELATQVRRGQLVRLQRGAYLAPPSVMPTDADARHRLTVAATVKGLRLVGAVSHSSAAVMHGLPLWPLRLARVHVLRRPPANGSGSARVHLHIAHYDDDELTVVDDVPVTDVTRTVVDLARSESFESAVITADAALRSGRTTADRLADRLASMGRVPGSRRAARVLAFADGASESVGESRSRVLMHRLGLPAPDLQVRVLRADGTVAGRCDFGWRAYRTVGEFDGRVKYGRLLKPGQSAGDVVFEEKVREDELRDLRWEVVRWTWADLSPGGVVAGRLHRAFARSLR